MVREINSTSEFNELTNGGTPVVVYFYADWCAPCKLIWPIFKTLPERLDLEGVILAKVDTEEQQEVATKWQVHAMPSFIAFQNGNIVGRALGAVPARLEELVRKAADLRQAPSTGAIETPPAPSLEGGGLPVSSEASTQDSK